MKITNFIICDDIRMEAGNKHSLMGIYSDSIKFHTMPDQSDKWPKAIRLAIFAQIELEKKEKLNDFQSFKIKIDYNGEIIEIAGEELPPPDSKTQKGVLIQAIFEKFKFNGPGEIKFIIQFYNKEKIKVSQVSPSIPLKVEETFLTVKP